MLTSFILTTLAGMSTLLGTILIFVKIENKEKLIAAACSFASAVMLCISILDLIPESILYLKENFKGISIPILTFSFILSGIILSMILDNFIDKVSNKNNLYKVGILSMIVIILHNIPEGIVTFIVSNKNIMLGMSICIAIALHNIPEGISIAIPIYFATNSKLRAIFYTLISALSEPLGAFITWIFLSKYINNTILGLLFAFIAGIMIQISFTKLLPTSNEYDKKNTKLFFVIGTIIMIVSLILNKLFT